jgi:hypothetical protein
MEQKIELPPLGFNRSKYGFHLCVVAHLERENDRCSQLLRQRAHEGFRLRIQISDGQFRAFGLESLRASPRNRMLVGDADDQPFFARERWVIFNATSTYSGTASPEPPNSLGKSFSLGSPSRIGKTVSE